ncbi:hypothetical protein IWZ03DRAFT_149278 [Phyllosticta citriasiana]|uniref:DUF7514 domain-containing protein n=1 Tax=Phyllosticta citriasiana TaxID=595635 RepID=A0ABR1KQ86_9PEZI
MAYEHRTYDSTAYDLSRHDSTNSITRDHVSPVDRPGSRPRLSRAPFSDRSQNSPRISPQDSQPVKEAVNDHLRRSGAISQLDPSIVAQITEEVRKQVIDSLRGPGQQPSPKPSPNQTSADPPRDVYTPPSPSRNENEYPVSPRSPVSPSSSAQDLHRRSSPKERGDQLAKNGGVRAASSLVASDHGSLDGTNAQQPSRSSPYARSAEIEETAIEKTWRPLFDSEGQPTARLGQFLRGLALHLINDYEPRHSLVITPAKMRKFYDEVRVQDETYCWASLFTSLPNSTVSKIYRDLRCEHHLVQDQLIAVPNIPALTPEGFKQWMTLMIQGHPDTEYERLSKAVMNMPISNADDSKERFPKELSRRLFPKTSNIGVRQRCATALSINGDIPLRTTSFPPPPPPPPPSSNRPSSQSSGGFSPTAKPSYSQWRAESFDTAVISEDSDNEPPPSFPIERERKPYSAREGSGKIYGDMPSSSRASTSSTASGTTTGSAQPFTAADFTNATRVRRAMSTQHNHGSGYPRPKPVFASEYPPNSMQTRNYRTGSTSYGSARRRSPSFSHGSERFGTRSEPNNVGDIPSSYYASNIYSESADDDETKNARRWREYENANGRPSYAPINPGRRTSIYEEDQFRKPTAAPMSSTYAAPNPYSNYPPPPPPRYA